VSLKANKKVVKNAILLELLFIGFEEKLEARESFPLLYFNGKEKRDKKKIMYFRQL
jgi:hypothetical protein